MSNSPNSSTLIDIDTISYLYDEEKNGFGEPPSTIRAPKNLSLMISAGVIGLGLLALTVSLLGMSSTLGWGAFLLSFGT